MITTVPMLWQQTEGPLIEDVQGVDTSEISFSAPGVADETEYEFQISVTDNSDTTVHRQPADQFQVTVTKCH